MTNEHIIAFENVCKSFGEHRVLDSVSFQIPRGQTTAIIGHSGAGKSVVLKHIVCLLQPDSGRVEVLGCDMASAPRAAIYATRKRMGMLFQNGALFESMSVGENVAFPLAQHRKDLSISERQDRVSEVLKQVELPGFERRSVADLSGGQRKRVGLARAIVSSPEVVLFDEPNSGLDPVTSEAIDELTLHLQKLLGITFVIISHDIVGTLKVADRVGMLYQGKLIECDEVSRIVQTENPIVRAFLKRNVQMPDNSLPALQDILGDRQ